jgi:hypothetical protein
LYDLSNARFEANNDEKGRFVNAIVDTCVTDCAVLIGDNVEMMDNDGTYHAIDPITPVISYYLSKHFDLHNLILQGFAIDATTLTNNPYKK